MKPPIVILSFFFLSITVFSQNQAEKKFVIPPYFLAKSEAYIHGPFDKDGSNTIIRFENNRMKSFDIKPLIEDKNKILIKVPDTYGQFELIVADEGNGNELFIPVTIVKLHTEYDKRFIGRKKTSKFKVKFLGAEKIDNEFNFSFQNKSPHIINIIGGNYQKQKITSTIGMEEVSWEGEMRQISDGEFLIMFNHTQPTPTVEIPVQ